MELNWPFWSHFSSLLTSQLEIDIYTFRHKYLFFFAMKHFLFICLWEVSRTSTFVIQRMKNTQMATSSINKSQATKKWSLT